MNKVIDTGPSASGNINNEQHAGAVLDKDDVLEQLTSKWLYLWNSNSSDQRGQTLWFLDGWSPRRKVPIKRKSPEPVLISGLWHLNKGGKGCPVILTREHGPKLILEEWIDWVWKNRNETRLRNGHSAIWDTVFHPRYTGMNVEEWRAIYPLLSPHTHFLPSSALQAPIAPSLAAPTFPARWPAGLDFEDTFTFYRNQPRYQEHLPPHPDRDYVVDSLLDAKRMVVLAGAGISVDAGIPSFRGPGGLLNQKNEAHSVFDIQSLSDRTKMEGHFRAMGTLAETCMSAQSTLFHVLLAVLGGLGCLKRLYSMNIDGLETRFHALRTCFPIPAKYSELPVTICLHGNLQTAVCGLCKRRKELVPEVYTKLDMTKIQCRECVSDRLHARSRRIQTTSTAGIGVLRPDVVLYNEPVDLEDSNVVNTTKAVQNDLSDWDVFLVVGTSASRQVYSLQARIKQIALSKKPGRSAKVIWLGLENPPQSLLPFLDHILIEDCQIVAKQFFHAGGADRVDTFLSSLRA